MIVPASEYGLKLSLILWFSLSVGYTELALQLQLIPSIVNCTVAGLYRLMSMLNSFASQDMIIIDGQK